ncbi:MAG: aspartyl/asparaginyl beta-hydroxylase domain-containing protein [Betaproteobacteria bacterium]|nr:MAG: aspartyl/asparaginyl beta-hydroxylase domain-containing protein [Betaproteobacteria bacterium]
MSRRVSVKLVVKAANIAIYRILLRPMEWLVRRFSSVGQHPFFDSSEFAWIPRLEAGWTTIRDELRALLRERGRIPNIQEISPEQLSLTRDDKWKSYWLCAFGRKIADNCRRCPETARLIEAIPGMESAFFSILASGRPALSPRARRTRPKGGLSHPGGFRGCPLGGRARLRVRRYLPPRSLERYRRRASRVDNRLRASAAVSAVRVERRGKLDVRSIGLHPGYRRERPGVESSDRTRDDRAVSDCSHVGKLNG